MKVFNRKNSEQKQSNHLHIISAAGVDGPLINKSRRDGLKKSLEYLEVEIEQIKVDFHLGTLSKNKEGQIQILLRYLESVVEDVKNLFQSIEQLDFISANILMDEIDERLNKITHNILIIKDFLIPKEEFAC